MTVEYMSTYSTAHYPFYVPYCHKYLQHNKLGEFSRKHAKVPQCKNSSLNFALNNMNFQV